MHIIGLQAENFKRLSAVALTLDGGNLILGGDNEQGKSSVLDAIWVALGGAEVMKDLQISKPLRKGAEKGFIKLDLGDLIVTRKFVGANNYLEVATRDGATYKSPQGMLDALMGKLFDPFEFSRMKGAEQREILLKLVNIGIDLDAWTSERKGIYDQRTDINREVARLSKTLELMPAVDAPDEEIMTANIFAEMEMVQAIQKANDDKRQSLRDVGQKYSQAIAKLQGIKDRVDGIDSEIKRLAEVRATAMDQANMQACEVEEIDKEREKLTAEVANLIDPDMNRFQVELAGVETVNANVRRKRERSKFVAELEAVQAQSDTLTANIAALDKTKSDAIKSASFPVKGLGFDDTGVTFNDLPFGQCSSEEKIRIGMAIAMAMSPRLKVVRISDGSLLDTKNFALIQEMAADKGYQLLIEKVGDPGEMGIIIEDGAVKQ